MSTSIVKGAQAICHNVGYRIAQIRLEKNYTQKAVADELGISLTAYGEIERGHTNPSLSRLFQIATVLNVSLSALFIAL